MAPRKKKVDQYDETAYKAAVVNSLSEALFGGFNPFGLNSSIGTQINQTDTLFVNERWYLISNFRQLLSQAYVEHGIIQTIIDVPVDDAFRGGVDIKSKQLSAEEIERLQIEMEQENDLGIQAQSEKWKRLFGGGGVITLTDQDPSTPLNIAKIKEDSPLEFRAVDMWELYFTKQNTQDYAAAIDQTTRLGDVEFYDYYGKKVHKSRVQKKTGKVAPSFIRPRLRGWGFSELENLVAPLNQYLKSNNLIFEVLDEFKVDYYKLKNLNSSIANPIGTAAIQRRIQMANQQKNYQNAVALDSEDDWIQKQLTFAGIAETMEGIRMGIASALRMPLTKIFGISSAGFSSGQDDIENYNSMIESTIRQRCKHDIVKMIEMRCQKLFGFVPDDIRIDFKPLRILSAEQEENVKTQKFTRILQNLNAGGMTGEEYKQALNKENLVEVQLDTSVELLEPRGEVEGESAGKEGTKVAKDAPA